MEPHEFPSITLNSGYKMPCVGMGTGGYGLPPTETLASILVDGIEIGYRHIDTAALYGTEEGVGLAAKQAVEKGLIKSRQELFITSKLWCTDAHPGLVIPAIHRTLERLGMDYVDLYLIHWPLRMKQGSRIASFSPNEDLLPFDILGTWKEMEECCKLGLAKSIGVSNYGHKKLTRILEQATIPPAINQVEMNVAFMQQNMVKFCKTKGIHVSAWSPLSVNGAFGGSLAVMESLILKEIAASKQKTVAQIALRWILQQGAIPIVRSFNKQRMKENLQIFDFELSEDDLAKIQHNIPQKRVGSGEQFIYEDGDYKSLEQLWDGDV